MRIMSVMRGVIMSSRMKIMRAMLIGTTMGMETRITIKEIIKKINKIKEIGTTVIIKKTSPTGGITKTIKVGIKTLQRIFKFDQSKAFSLPNLLIYIFFNCLTFF